MAASTVTLRERVRLPESHALPVWISLLTIAVAFGFYRGLTGWVVGGALVLLGAVLRPLFLYGAGQLGLLLLYHGSRLETVLTQAIDATTVEILVIEVLLVGLLTATLISQESWAKVLLFLALSTDLIGIVLVATWVSTVLHAGLLLSVGAVGTMYGLHRYQETVTTVGGEDS